MFNKFMLFVSSYIPLYVLLILKNVLERVTDGGRFINIIEKLKNARLFDEVNDGAISVLLLTTVLSSVYLKIVIKKSGGNKKYKIIDVSDETGNIYFTYISIYLLSCLGLTLNSIVDCFVFLFVMLVVGYIYISNNMMYMNPVINIMGYKVYDCVLKSVNTSDDEMKSIVVVPKETTIKVNSELFASGKQGFIFARKK